jgi:hypothetical protein
VGAQNLEVAVTPFAPREPALDQFVAEFVIEGSSERRRVPQLDVIRQRP